MERMSTRIERQESAFGSWTRALRAPNPRIRPLLARDFLGFIDTAPPSRSWLLPPTGTASLILNLGTSFGGLPDAFVAGLDTTFAVVERSTPIACIDLKLTPLGAYTLLAQPMDAIAGRAVNLRDLVGASGGQLVEALNEAPDWDERFALLDRFLLHRAEHGPRPSAAVAWAWQRLTDSGGQIPIGELAMEIGWSQRHLIARFRQQVGLPPKTMARIVRFAGVLRHLEAAEAVRWAELAGEHGYADQAHLNRDFREFAGTTPTAFLARRGGSDGVGREVNSFQDRR
ncbi:MAG: helix-turn-helix domain-containing protein [Dehalococcoidia bacterium]